MLNFKLLGTAAGGGFPQWNCACTLCNRSRLTPSAVPSRLHLQAILSADGPDQLLGQFLINASPDLRFQIEANLELWPSAAGGRRNTPIAGIVLTSAELDQVLGLFLLREFQPLTIYATPLVRRTLEANSFFQMLHRVPSQVTWVEIFPDQTFTLGGGIACTPIPFAGPLPYYARDVDAGAAGQASIGLLVEFPDESRSESRSCRLAYTPSLPEITDELLALYDSCAVILVDGTFWSDAELSETHAGTPLARAIGHIPMSGEKGTIALLAGVNRPRKIFIHINNTNPVLDPQSAERKIVEDAGWQIGDDGWQLN